MSNVVNLDVIRYGDVDEVNNELDKLLLPFGQNLCLLREMRGIELKDAASKTNVPTTSLYRIERGEVYPRIDILVKLLVLYDISIDRLVDIVSIGKVIKGESDCEYVNEMPLTIIDENEALNLARRIIEQQFKKG